MNKVVIFNYKSKNRCQKSCIYESQFNKIAIMSAMVKYKEIITTLGVKNKLLQALQFSILLFFDLYYQQIFFKYSVLLSTTINLKLLLLFFL